MIFGERLVDLDELVLRCRGEQARQYIAEAVACYRAGAFRASIVATWVAVVFDFIHKLDELALTGDKEAAAKRSEYEDIRRAADVRRSLRFEEELLDLAKDKFELISPVEHQDLQRLKDDRNRCAHPSMTAYDEVYQPSAELARYHLRNAVTYLLQHPPVQGQAALDRLMRDVASPYFPTRHEDVLMQLRSGPLARPRVALVRNFALALLKTLLLEDVDVPTFQRHVAVLRAVRTLHHATVEQVFTQRLSDLIRRLEAQHYGRLVHLLELLPEAQAFLQDDVVNRLALYVEQADVAANPGGLIFALDFPLLREAALARVGSLPVDAMKQLITHQPHPEFIDRILTLYEGAGSFYVANDFATTLLLPLGPLMGFPHLERILRIAVVNSQVLDSNQFPSVLQMFRSSGKIAEADFQSALLQFTIQHPYKERWLVSLFDELHFQRLLELLFEHQEEQGFSRVMEWLREAKRANCFPEPLIEERRAYYKARYDQERTGDDEDSG